MSDLKKAKNYDTVIALHCKGKSIKDIARRTELPEQTVRQHIKSFFRSLS